MSFDIVLSILFLPILLLVIVLPMIIQVIRGIFFLLMFVDVVDVDRVDIVVLLVD